MKSSLRFHFALLTACAALPVGGLLAQAPAVAAPATTPSVSAPAKSAETAEEEEGGKMRERYMALTPEEKTKIRAANKAARQDPAVKAAEATRATDKQAYRQALRAAMLKADPSVEPILEKMRDAKTKKKDL